MKTIRRRPVIRASAGGSADALGKIPATI